MNSAVPEKTPFSLYLHFPFCRHKCGYCGFYSEAAAPDEYLTELYLKALEKEFKHSREMIFHGNYSSVYIGGGNPGLFSLKGLNSLSGIVRPYTDNCEWTIEANPENITENFLKTCEENGINRLSMGIQTLDNRLLRKLGRNGSREMSLKALDNVDKFWNGKVNVDLMYGLPDEKDYNLKDTFRRIIDYNPGHISVYCLTLEENTPLYKRLNGFIDREGEEDNWALIKGILFTAGYSRYEISNFCRSGNECSHNLSYWDLTPYVALGPSAVSMFKSGEQAVRSTGIFDIKKYLSDPLGTGETEVIGFKDLMKDYLLMNLRKSGGFLSHVFTDIFHNDFGNLFPETIGRFKRYFIIDSSSVRLNDEGLDILNTVLVSLFSEMDNVFFDKEVHSWPLGSS